MLQVNAVKYKKMSYHIIEQFIDKISSGELKVGDKLPPERVLSEKFNVSRTTLREALSVMEVMGIVEMRVGEGSFITDLNIIPFIQMISNLFVRTETMETELLDLRRLLEVEAVRLILNRDVSKEEMDLLHEQVINMEQSLTTNDVEQGAEADLRFHQMLFTLSNNYILQKAGQCIASIMGKSVRFNRGKILRDVNNHEVLYHQHSIIYKALLEKDEQMAISMINKHLDFVKQMI